MKNSNLNNILRILAVTAVLVFCIQVFSDNKADVDLWGNVGFVKALPWSAGFHNTNTFSFTEPDHPWTNHEWLAQYLLFITYERLGNTGLLVIKIILGLCVVFLINRSMKDDCRSRAIRFLYLMLIISTIGYGFSTRPHHFTYLMYALFLFLLKQHGNNSLVTLLLMPTLGLLWANLHGAFFLGAVLLGAYTVLETVKVYYFRESNQSRNHLVILLATIVLFVAATFVNPYGLKLWGFILQSAVKTRPYLSEWAMFNPLKDFYTHIDFMVLALITFLAVCFSQRRKDITWTGILIFSFIAAVLMRRNIPLFAITVGFAAPRHVENAAGGIVSRVLGRIPEKILVPLLAVFILLSVYYCATFNKTNPLEIEIPTGKFPVDTVAFMRKHQISGNALVFFDWAEYCIWKLYPDCSVFLDGRFRSAYSLRTINDYFNFLYLGKNWDNALNHYPADIVLIHRGNPVYEKMLVMPGWKPAYQSRFAGLFLKSEKHGKFLNALDGVITVPHRTSSINYFP